MTYSLVKTNEKKPFHNEDDVIDLYYCEQLTEIITYKKNLIIINIDNVHRNNDHHFPIKFNDLIETLCLIGSCINFKLRLEAFEKKNTHIKNLLVIGTSISELKFERCHIKNLICFPGAINHFKLDRKYIGKLVIIHPRDKWIKQEIFNKKLLSV